MTQHDIATAHTIEAASRRAYPPLHEETLDELKLGAADGYTKRANSAQPTHSPLSDPRRAIAQCERFYAARSQPAIFRLLSYQPDAALDAALDARGYALVEPSRVMLRELPAADDANGTALQTWSDGTAWSELHASLSGHAPEPAYAKMLRRVQATQLMAVMQRDGRPIACGMGVADGSWLGLFNLVVAGDQRGRGLGTELVESLLAAGRAQGASRAYLQVVAANPAVRLYERLGFADSYRYHYRVRRMNG